MLARVDTPRLEGGGVGVASMRAAHLVAVTASNAVQWADRWGAEQASYAGDDSGSDSLSLD